MEDQNDLARSAVRALKANVVTGRRAAFEQIRQYVQISVIAA
jgi:hypothetical protein